MGWNSDQLDRASASEELYISSYCYRHDGSLRRSTTIWVVRVGDDLYARSAYGTEGGWYRNAMRHQMPPWGRPSSVSAVIAHFSPWPAA